MRNWKKHIQRHQAYNNYPLPAEFNYDMVVVIPCFAEPDLLTTLKSLMQCAPTEQPVGVLVVVNSSELTEEAIVEKTEQLITKYLLLQKSTISSNSLFMHFV